MHVYRICDDRFSVLDGTGAALNGGRWNSKGHPVVYGSETYALALLETLVHTGFRKLPGGRHYARVNIPAPITIESFDPAAHAGWELADCVASRTFGDRWISEQRSVLLRVPSAVTRGPEWNIVLNQAHPQFSAPKIDPPQAVYWDPRLMR